jgi:hypothetical protein
VAPQGTETAIEYGHISKGEFFDYLANQRLNDRLIQTFQEMSLQTSRPKASGIAAPSGRYSVLKRLPRHSSISLPWSR